MHVHCANVDNRIYLLTVSRKKEMDNLIIAGTPKTPSVEMNASTGAMTLKGRSIPENSIEFYKPIMSWLDEYSKNPQGNTIMNIQLEYFNTSSSKCLLDLFKRLENVNGDVCVNWHYEKEDEDMLEAGEDYEAIVNVTFKMVEVDHL
jgi:hypothetical protein